MVELVATKRTKLERKEKKLRRKGIVMVNVVGNQHSDPSSNPERFC